MAAVPPAPPAPTITTCSGIQSSLKLSSLNFIPGFGRAAWVELDTAHVGPRLQVGLETGLDNRSRQARHQVQVHVADETGKLARQRMKRAVAKLDDASAGRLWFKAVLIVQRESRLQQCALTRRAPCSRGPGLPTEPLARLGRLLT